VKFEVLHPAEDVERRGPDPKEEVPHDMDELRRDLHGAALAAGQDDVEQALQEIATGKAKPEALMWWIDDLRDPERHEQPESVADLQEGIVPDFIADTEFAGGGLDVHDEIDADEAVFFSGTEQAEVPDSDADADYFFSAVRKRNRGDDDDDADKPPDDGGGDGGGKKTAERAKKPKKLRR